MKLGEKWNQKKHLRNIRGKNVPAGKGRSKDSQRSKKQEERWAKAGKVKERTIDEQKDTINRQTKAATREASKRNYEVEYAGATVKSDAPRKDQTQHDTDDVVREV